MKMIWKYELMVVGEQKISMPVGAKVLSVQMQKGRPCIWVLVNEPTGSDEIHTFFIHGTGHLCERDASEFIGTFQMDDGGLVFHLFESDCS